MKKPLISVVMATFNEPPDYITQSIQSILNQTLSDFELLLIDDSTNMDTVITIDSMAQRDKRIKVIRSSQRIGFVPALNIGLKQAQGEYIARMDGDDISLPNRFELQISYLKNNPDIAVAGGAMHIINEKGEIISHRNYATRFYKIKLYALIRSPLAHPTVMIRKNIIEKELYYDEFFRKAEDIELWLRLMKTGHKISNMPNKILLFRISANFANKRIGDHFLYNYKARKKNFSWKQPLWSFISILISKIYIMLPETVIHALYEKENTKFKGKKSPSSATPVS
jgi:glycosyltransferase involved in cell wall biosynthesis